MSWIKRLAFVAILSAATALTAQQLILDGRTIDLEPGSQVIVNSQGDVVITSDDGDLTCFANTNPPTVSLLVNGSSSTSISSGSNVNVTWTHQFADSCTATGGSGTNWSATNVNSSPGAVTLTNVTASTTLTLSCSNTFGTTPVNASITVQGGGGGDFAGFEPPADCPATAPPPPGTTRENPLEEWTGLARITRTNNFEGAYGSKWPGIALSKPELFLERNKYVAIGFNTGDRCTSSGSCNRTDGFIEFEVSILGDGNKVVSVSRCPGDFSNSLGECRQVQNTRIRWQYDSVLPTVCSLDSNAQYYLNIIHGTDADPSTTTCTSSECGILTQVR